MRLETLQRNDIPRCVEIEAILFPEDDPWNSWAFHSELDADNFYLAARTEDLTLAGYAGLAVVGTPGEYEASVHTLGVDPRYQRQGVGGALLEALLAHADSFAAPVFLEVRTDNAAALALYQKYGFSQIGLRKRYYQPSGADAFTMARPTQTSVASKGESH